LNQVQGLVIRGKKENLQSLPRSGLVLHLQTWSRKLILIVTITERKQ
jgi:hypothetical protein